MRRKRFAEAAVEYLVRNNILYVLSALLMLVGSFLVSIPYLHQHRQLGVLLVLLGVVNLYEAMVVSAIAYVCRRAPLSRESTTLILVETLFLFDATFTVNAFVPASYGWGLGVSAAALALAAVKIFAIEIGAGRGVFASVRIFLLGALVFVYGFQGVLALFGHAAAKEAATYAVWLAFGSLPLLLAFSRVRPWSLDAPGEWRSAEPLWRDAGFGRAMVFIGMGLGAAQLVGASWVHGSPWRAGFAMPLVMSCLVVFPMLVQVRDRIVLNAPRAVATIIAVGALLVAAPPAPGARWTVEFGGSAIETSPLMINIIFAAGCFALMWLRERTPGQLEAACALGVLGLFAHTSAGAAALGLIRWTPVAALVAVTLLEPAARRRRGALRMIVFTMGLLCATAGDPQSLACFAAATAALGLAALFEGRRGLYAFAAYMVAANLLLGGLPVPETAAQWGSATIALAFAVFGAGLLVMRRGIAAPRPGAGAGEEVYRET